MPPSVTKIFAGPSYSYQYETPSMWIMIDVISVLSGFEFDYYFFTCLWQTIKVHSKDANFLFKVIQQCTQFIRMIILSI